MQRLAEVPGLGVDSAQQVIAEVGATAATFPSPHQLASWVGACPGDKETAGVNYSHRSPQGNRQMRRLLHQAANAAVKTKGSIFQLVYRRLVPHLGHAKAIWAIAHRLCRLIWKILHQGVRYEERGPAVSRTRTLRRAAKMIREPGAVDRLLDDVSYRGLSRIRPPGSLHRLLLDTRFAVFADTLRENSLQALELLGRQRLRVVGRIHRLQRARRDVVGHWTAGRHPRVSVVGK